MASQESDARDSNHVFFTGAGVCHIAESALISLKKTCLNPAMFNNMYDNLFLVAPWANTLVSGTLLVHVDP